MANKINEVWYCYNAKGNKIPPYKSNYVHQQPRTLLGRVWCMCKENWYMLLIYLALIGAIMFGMLHLMMYLLS